MGAVSETLQNLIFSLRWIRKLHFKLRGHVTIYPIPTDQFNTLVAGLMREGWVKKSEYQGIDAWLDYGRIVLARQGARLLCEWDNWDEGSIEGRRDILQPIAQAHSLPIMEAWRWSVYDTQQERT